MKDEQELDAAIAKAEETGKAARSAYVKMQAAGGGPEALGQKISQRLVNLHQ